MFFLYYRLILLFFFSSFHIYASTSPPKNLKLKSIKNQNGIKILLLKHLKKELDKKSIKSFKKMALKYAGKSIPALVEAIKSSKYPDKNRWIATFLVGRIMGKKSAPFISKLLHHPNWMLRLASLKTLLALKQVQYSREFAKALKDKSFIVRKQALNNITKLSLDRYAPFVWAMLYDKRNYYLNKKGGKRTSLIKDVIKSVGKLKFKKAKKPLLSMVQKDKYKDIFKEIDYSLEKIMNKKSPQGEIGIKRHFWKKVAIAEEIF